MTPGAGPTSDAKDAPPLPRWTAVVHFLDGRKWISTTVTVEAGEASTAARRAVEEAAVKALKPRTRIAGVRLNLTRVKNGGAA